MSQSKRHQALKPITLGWVCVYFIVLTVIMTWPLASGLGRLEAGNPGDNFFFVWLIEWYQKSIFVQQASPFFVPTLNFPEGYSLGYTEYTPATVFTALPLTMLFGPVASYNVVILSTFVLSGLGVYLWVYRLSAGGRPSLIAATIFAFCTYRMNHLGGHITLEGTQWLPLYFLSLDRVLDMHTWSWRRAGLASLFLVLMSMTAPYYLYMALVLSIPYIAGYRVLHDVRSPSVSSASAAMPRRAIVTRLRSALAVMRGLTLRSISAVFHLPTWARFTAVCLLAAPGVVLSVAPYLQLRAQGSFAPHSWAEASFYSAGLTDFMAPMTSHVLWGQLLTRLYNGENALYLGMVALCLSGIAFFKQKAMKHQQPAILLLCWTGFCSVILAMGVALHWLSAEIHIQIPPFIQQWWPRTDMFIPLPGYFLYRLLPFYSSMRVWMRYGVFASLCVSAVAGIGAAWVLNRIQPRWQSVATALILGLALLDSYVGPYLVSEVTTRPVDLWLATQPGAGAVATFPFDDALTPLETFYAGTYGKPFIGGHFAAFRSPQFERIQPILKNFPDEHSVTLLKSLSVQYVLVDSTRYRDFNPFLNRIESYGLRMLVAMDGTYVLEIPGP